MPKGGTGMRGLLKWIAVRSRSIEEEDEKWYGDVGGSRERKRLTGMGRWGSRRVQKVTFSLFNPQSVISNN